MWVFSFDAPNGKRVFKRSYFRGITTYNKLWFSYKTKTWVLYPTLCEHKQGGSTHDDTPRSFKAFKKYLNNQTELQQKGVEVVLIDKYYNRFTDNYGSGFSYAITAKWVEE